MGPDQALNSGVHCQTELESLEAVRQQPFCLEQICCREHLPCDCLPPHHLFSLVPLVSPRPLPNLSPCCHHLVPCHPFNPSRPLLHHLTHLCPPPPAPQLCRGCATLHETPMHSPPQTQPCVTPTNLAAHSACLTGTAPASTHCVLPEPVCGESLPLHHQHHIC